MSFVPSVHAYDFVKPIQSVEETGAYGTFPTVSPSFTMFDVPMVWRPAIDLAHVEPGRQGVEDIYKILKTGEIYKSVLETGLINSTHLKYGILARGGGAGSIDKVLSLICSIRINEVENYIKMPGTRIDSLTLTMVPNDLIKVSYNLSHKSIDTPGTTHGLTTPVFAGAPTADPWTHLDAGADPLQWNAVAQKLKRFSCTINRHLSPQQTNGNAQISFLPSTKRRLVGDFEHIWDATTIEADLKAGTARTLSIVLKSATSTLTLTNAKAVSLARDTDVESGEVISQVVGVKCETFSIT